MTEARQVSAPIADGASRYIIQPSDALYHVVAASAPEQRGAVERSEAGIEPMALLIAEDYAGEVMILFSDSVRVIDRLAHLTRLYTDHTGREVAASDFVRTIADNTSYFIIHPSDDLYPDAVAASVSKRRGAVKRSEADAFDDIFGTNTNKSN